jgi:DNA-binding NtrC family response regulator
MENSMTDTVPARDARAYLGHDTDARAELRDGRAAQELAVLQVPVGTNLADVERWMIFATLQKCGGNKTRAAALLGVSLKTLYNRLNAYRAQGLVMDYAATAQRDIEITGMHADLVGELTEVPG